VDWREPEGVRRAEDVERAMVGALLEAETGAIVRAVAGGATPAAKR
jgi:hypothetical protein